MKIFIFLILSALYLIIYCSCKVASSCTTIDNEETEDNTNKELLEKK
jgi:Na+-transporting methylmalonyl-CoA/oxaloacetate decarboxylase gamma subunit